MRPEQASAWYRRMSAVYALGAWTVLGGLIFSGRQKSKLVGTALQDLARGMQPSVGLPQGPRSSVAVRQS